MKLTRVALSWRPAITGQLLLQIDAGHAGIPPRAAVVPGGVIHALRETSRLDVTGDPAGDLIRAESRWRLRAAQLKDTITELYRAAVTAFADLHELPPTPGQLVDQLTDRAFRAERRYLSTLLRTAVDQLATSISALAAAGNHIRAIRTFVTGLDLAGIDAPAGLLAGTQAGWRRDPARPAYVSAYANEETFVIANPHRANPHRANPHDTQRPQATSRPGRRGAAPQHPGAAVGRTGRMVRPVGGLVAGEVFGVGWRRDGDDDDPYTDEPAVLGPWQLGYIPATGEIYATRRCHYRDPQVWLLARGHTNPDRARQLLSTLKRRMGEPNSLLLAAHAAAHSSNDTDDPGAEIDLAATPDHRLDHQRGADDLGWG